MQLSLEIAATLAERSKAAANSMGETHEHFALVALAGRVAHLEHLDWLRQNMPLSSPHLTQADIGAG